MLEGGLENIENPVDQGEPKENKELDSFLSCVITRFLCQLGLWIIHEDGTFYYSNVEGNLQGEIFRYAAN